MANRPAPALVLREGDREELARITRATSVRAGLAQRARIVLAASDGEANERIAERVGVSKVTVLQWRTRYAEHGIKGLDDQARSGRPRTIDHRKIVATTLKPPPKTYGVTHWSSRLLGQHLGIGNATVATAWREYGVQPWRSETFTFPTDPELVAKVTDVVGGSGSGSTSWPSRSGRSPRAGCADAGERVRTPGRPALDWGHPSAAAVR